MSYLNITITTQANLSFVTGGYVQVIHDSSNYIVAQVVSYNSSTGSLTFKPVIVVGSGTYTSWTIICSSSPGENGTSGTSGTSGVNGTSGSSGTSGLNGTSGISGTSGTSGVSGTSGTSGIDGTSGVSGTSGTSGIDGAAGTSGVSGTSGTSGVDGTSGTSGTSGATGTSGAAGTSGTSGTSGSTPNPNARTETTFTATAGQTTFTVAYTVGQVDVYYNGSKLAPAEFTATNGTSITLAIACQVNDIVNVVAYITGAGVGGGGTNNYVPKFTGSTTIGNSSLQQVGSGWMELGDSSVNTGELDIIGNSGSKVFLYDGYGSATMQSYYNDSFTILTQVGGQTTNVMDYNYVTKTLIFQTNGNNTRLNITSSGNVGIGNTNNTYKLDVTGTGRFTGNLGVGIGPSAWGGSDVYAIDVSLRGSLSAGGTDVSVVNNAYYNGSNWIYKETDYASYYQQLSGVHRWFVAGSGTAGGTVSFAEKMRITSEGYVLIGATSSVGAGANRLQVSGGGQAQVLLTNTGGGCISLYSTGTDAYLTKNTGGGSMLFGISPSNGATFTEQMRITSGGQVIIGSTASLYPSVKLSIKQTSANIPAEIWSNYSGDSGSAAVMLIKYDNSSSSSQVFQRFVIDNGNTACGQINGNGASQVAFGSWSDSRLKNNIENLPSQLSNIMALRPVEFDYKNGSGHQIGFIAQEMKEVYPDAVGEDTDGFLTITGWSKTEARLVKAIQEQQAQIEELKAKIK